MTKKQVNESIRIAKEGIGECWDDMAGVTGQTPEGEGPMTVTINMPGKNISVTTDSADEIANILKLAGIQVGGVAADGPAEMPGEMPAEEPAVMYVGAEPAASEVSGDNDGDGDHDMQDHDMEHEAGESEEEEESEDDVEEAVGDTSYTSKGGKVTQTATGLTHQAGSGTYGGTETDAEEEARKKADDEAAKKEVNENAGGKVRQPASQWLQDPRLEAQVMSLTAYGINVTDPAKGFDGDDANDPGTPSKYSLISTKATNPMYFNEFLNMVMKKDPAAQVVGMVQAGPDLANEVTEETARILQLAGVTNEAQSAAQKAAFAKMIAAKKGDKSEDKADDKDDNKKPDADGDGVPDWADKKDDKEVKEEAPATNSIYGQGVYEADRIIKLSGLGEGKLANSPAGTSMDEPTEFDSLPSAKGEGSGHKDFGANRANGQGENPMGLGESSVEQKFQDALGEYRKFVAESISRKK
jgi:hypothetical protein